MRVSRCRRATSASLACRSPPRVRLQSSESRVAPPPAAAAVPSGGVGGDVLSGGGGDDGARHVDLGGLRETGELAPEEGLGGGQVLPLDPGDVVAVGTRRGEREVSAGGEGGVEKEHLRKDQRQRPAVEEEVVKRPHQPMLGGAETQEGDAQEGRPRRRETPPAILGEKAGEARLALAGRQMAPIFAAERQRDGALHRLERPLLALPHEGRAEHRVPLDHPLPGAREGARVERPGERAAQLLYIDPRFRGVQTVEKDPFLQGGQGIDVFEVPRGHVYQGVPKDRRRGQRRQIGKNERKY